MCLWTHKYTYTDTMTIRIDKSRNEWNKTIREKSMHIYIYIYIFLFILLFSSFRIYIYIYIYILSLRFLLQQVQPFRVEYVYSRIFTSAYPSFSPGEETMDEIPE